ncbi:MAG: S8 family serine peptidase, partial [Actinomycetota bacterium]|nr:S8 family serine peptidase [Actinomycetota bacterium]
MAHSEADAVAPPIQRRLASVVAMFALLASLVTVGLPQADWRTYLLPADAPVPTGARVLRALPLVDGVVVSAPTVLPGAVSLAEPLHWRSLAPQPDTSGVRLDSGVATTRADQAWPTTRGERAVVALIDTGVAPLPVLDGAVAGEIDFSGTGGGDPFGHGTFLASLIAARGPLAPGVAPGTGILSLKVGGPDGGTSLGAVLAALQ